MKKTTMILSLVITLVISLSIFGLMHGVVDSLTRDNTETVNFIDVDLTRDNLEVSTERIYFSVLGTGTKIVNYTNATDYDLELSPYFNENVRGVISIHIPASNYSIYTSGYNALTITSATYAFNITAKALNISTGTSTTIQLIAPPAVFYEELGLSSDFAVYATVEDTILNDGFTITDVDMFDVALSALAESIYAPDYTIESITNIQFFYRFSNPTASNPLFIADYGLDFIPDGNIKLIQPPQITGTTATLINLIPFLLITGITTGAIIIIFNWKE